LVVANQLKCAVTSFFRGGDGLTEVWSAAGLMDADLHLPNLLNFYLASQQPVVNGAPWPIADIGGQLQTIPK
jgi:hypothetical protein